MKQASRLFGLCAVVTLISAFTSAGFSIAALFSSGAEQINAMYGASRSISLALAVVLVVSLRNYSGLMTLSLIMTLIQAGDALIGGLTHDVVKTLGPAFLSIVTATALWMLFRSTTLAVKNHGNTSSTHPLK